MVTVNITIGKKSVVVNIKDLQLLYRESNIQTKHVLERVFTKDLFKNIIEDKYPIEEPKRDPEVEKAHLEYIIKYGTMFIL